VSERQIMEGKPDAFKLLIVPAVKYIDPDVVKAIVRYIRGGGTAVVIPESFVFDQYARNGNMLSELGIAVTDVTLPPVVGEGEQVQNYDQSFSQKLIYGEVQKEMTTNNKDIFKDKGTSLTLTSDGLVQSVDPGPHEVLAAFDDGKAAILLSKIGNGSLYYLAAPLKTRDYHLLFAPLAEKLGLKRPVVGVDQNGNLITGAEVRAVERARDYLVYASNLSGDTVKFDLKGARELGSVTDLRSLRTLPDKHVKLGPYQERLFKIFK
jgi:hypothetical protein